MAFKKNKIGIFLENEISNEDIKNLTKHKRTQTVTLKRIKNKDLAFLSELKNLKSIRFYSCSIDDYSYLKNFKKLEDIFINTIRKKDITLDFLSEIESLEELGFGYIPNLITFPNLSKCHKLKRVKIFNCKRLEEIDNIVLIPNLESFGIVETPQKPQDL